MAVEILSFQYRGYNLTPPTWVTAAQEPYPLEGTRGDKIMYFEGLVQRHGMNAWVCAAIAQLVWPGCPSEAVRYFRQALQLAADSGADLTKLEQTADGIDARLEKAARASLEALASDVTVVQRWKPTIEHAMPSGTPCPDVAPEVAALKAAWQHQTSDLLARYLVDAAINTQEIEGTFRLEPTSAERLIRRGISANSVIYAHYYSRIKDEDTIAAILLDTCAAYDLLEPIVHDADRLTPQAVCEIHARAMQRARFPATVADVYVPPGRTRSATLSTVAVAVELVRDAHGIPDGARTAECCPYPTVDGELEQICALARGALADTARDPFALASWLQVVLAGCHPFNDGNGRVCRLLASIPLLRAGYPPLSVSLAARAGYFAAIREAYAGDHRALVRCFLQGMQECMRRVRSI